VAVWVVEFRVVILVFRALRDSGQHAIAHGSGSCMIVANGKSQPCFEKM
jgi:hypothetical protein